RVLLFYRPVRAGIWVSLCGDSYVGTVVCTLYIRVGNCSTVAPMPFTPWTSGAKRVTAGSRRVGFSAGELAAGHRRHPHPSQITRASAASLVRGEPGQTGTPSAPSNTQPI